MIQLCILLSLLGLSQGRPQSSDVYEPHDDCPADKHWLLPHEYDCTKFYYCEYGLKWIEPRDCSPGTEFSFELQVCVHPMFSECNLPGSPTSEQPTEETDAATQSTTAASTTTANPTSAVTTEPTAASTTAAITEATTAPTTEATTPSTTVSTTASTTVSTAASTTVATTEPTSETTTPSTTVSTTASTTVSATAPTTVSTTISTTNATAVLTTEATTEPTTEATTVSTTASSNDTTVAPTTEFTTTTQASTESQTDSPTTQPDDYEYLDNGCPADFHVHWLLPHETACDKFYYCVRGEKIERNCTRGTYFNPELQVCDWAENVDCAKDSEGDNDNGDDDNDDNTDEEDRPDPESGENETPEDGELLPNGCPADFDVHKLLPHETDCDKFYYCVFGEAVERDCAPGTYFNYEIQVCDWPYNVNCTAGNEDNEAEEEDENVDDLQAPTPALANGCPADFHVHKLLPHETNCSRFYYCVSGEKVERECAPGTHFNYELQVCDWPWKAECEISGSENGEGDNDNGDNGNSENGNQNGDANGDDENEDNVNGGEGSENVTVPALPNGCPVDFHVHHLLPHENNCSKFYYCVFGEKVERDCPNGTHFNPVWQVCDWPWSAGCESSGSDNENGGNGNGDNDNEDDDGNGNEDDDDNNQENGSSEDNGNDGEDPDDVAVPELPNGCPADFEVHHLLPHENNCSKFYYCVLGEKVERDCPNGTHFNPNYQVCDWPWSAGCETGESDNGNGDNGNGDNGNEDNGDEENDDNEDDENEDNDNEDNENEDNDNEDNDNEDNDNEDNDNEDNDNEDNENEGNGNEDNDNEDNDNEDNDNEDNGSEDSGNGDGDNNRCNDLCNALPWAHETDCDKYWICNARTPTLIVCSEGLHFNANTHACDFMCNANCVREVVQATAASDGVKLFLPWDKIDDSMLNYLLKTKN